MINGGHKGGFLSALGIIKWEIFFFFLLDWLWQDSEDCFSDAKIVEGIY